MVSINKDASVLARAEIEIDADQETVWNVLADVERWPKWNPNVKQCLAHGELESGTQFQWKASLGNITSVLQNVEPPHLLAWTGKMMGLNAIHVCKIDFVDNKTIVRTEESWEGLVSSDMHDKLQETLETLLQSCLEHLKTEVERLSN